MSSVGAIADIVGILAFGALGALCAWITRRFTTLSARNFYAPAAVSVAVLGVAVGLRVWRVVLGIAPVCAFAIASATHGRRMRLADLGGSQGELVHRRPWPDHVAYVPMGDSDRAGMRLPPGEGQHIFACGATGSGKTTTTRRVLAARTLTQGAALLWGTPAQVAARAVEPIKQSEPYADRPARRGR